MVHLLFVNTSVVNYLSVPSMLVGEVKYQVTVPERVRVGDYFNAQLGASVYTIRCPEGATPGTMLDVRVPQQQGQFQGAPPHYTVTVVRQQPVVDMQEMKRRLTSFLCGRIASLIILFILLTLAYALPVFATMTLSQNCQASNPIDGSKVNRMYYNLYRGLGNTQTCSTSQSKADFCLKWSNNAFWSRVDDFAGSNMQSESQFEWPFASVVVPLSSAFCFLAVLAIANSVFKLGNESIPLESIDSILSMALSLTLLVWVLSFMGINVVVYTSTMSPIAWSRFFLAGYPLQALLDDTVALTTPQVVQSCSVTIRLAEGGIILSVATTLAFINCLIPCFAMCTAQGNRY